MSLAVRAADVDYASADTYDEIAWRVETDESTPFKITGPDRVTSVYVAAGLTDEQYTVLYEIRVNARARRLVDAPAAPLMRHRTQEGGMGLHPIRMGSLSASKQPCPGDLHLGEFNGMAFLLALDHRALLGAGRATSPIAA